MNWNSEIESELISFENSVYMAEEIAYKAHAQWKLTGTTDDYQAFINADMFLEQCNQEYDSYRRRLAESEL